MLQRDLFLFAMAHTAIQKKAGSFIVTPVIIMPVIIRVMFRVSNYTASLAVAGVPTVPPPGTVRRAALRD
jgi:hypothetical protein